MYKSELHASAHTIKMVAASSSKMQEQITNQDGITTHKSAIFNVYFKICTWKEQTTITHGCHHMLDMICVMDTLNDNGGNVW